MRMNKVTFGKRIKSTEEDTQAILLNGVEIGTLYARRTNNHNLTIGLCPSLPNPNVWDDQQWFISEYAVLFNDATEERVWDLSKGGEWRDARETLSEVKKWVRAALAPAPVEAPAPEAPEAPLPMASEIDSEEWGRVSYDDIASLLCCAFEGGSNYWARVRVAYDPSEEELNSPAFGDWRGFRAYMITHPDWVVEIRALEGETRIIKLPDLLKGLEIMREKYPRHWADFMGGNSVADTGDVFLQCATLGEIVYG
jgi:hypothetical protein